jgi:hypothetical protein
MEKLFKGELFMADCVQGISRLRSCLLSVCSILADAPFLRTFRELSGLGPFVGRMMSDAQVAYLVLVALPFHKGHNDPLS